MSDYSIGIDNGCTGSICILDEDGKVVFYGPTPVFKSLNYTKAVGYSTRVDGKALSNILDKYALDSTLVLERPMVNPQRWVATISAIRCDETTRTVLEMLKVKFIYIDSKEWQKSMLPKRSPVKGTLFKLPKGAKKTEYLAERKANKELKAKRAAFALETKSLSLAIGQRLFPNVTFEKDADAALMCEWLRRTKL